MTDKLTQIGKHISKQHKDIKHVLKDTHQHFSLVERVRDFLGAQNDFNMEFETYVVGNGVYIDIDFEPFVCGEGGGF